VLDIKPYLPYVDIVPDAINTFADKPPVLMPVQLSEECAAFCDDYRQKNDIELDNLIRQLLQQDPRPQYQQPEVHRVYGMKLLDLDIQWHYPNGTYGYIEVIAIHPLTA
jgi:hypothetical protein